MRFRATVSLVVALSLGCTLASWPSGEARAQAKADVAAAKKAYFEGEQAFQAGRYPEAERLFRKGYELSGKARFLLNIGHAQRLGGHLDEAMATFRQFLETDPKPEDRADAEKAIADIEARRSSEPPPATAPPVTTPDAPTPVTDAETPPGLLKSDSPAEPPPVSKPEPAAPVVPAPVVPAAAVVAEDPVAPAESPAVLQEEAQPPEEKAGMPWYFWGGLGAVVVGGVVAAIILSSGGDEPAFQTMGSWGSANL